MKNSYKTLTCGRLLFSELVIGELIRFGYNGTDRIGTLEKVFERSVCVKLADGKYKSFTLSKMTPLSQFPDSY
jgi:hypothetical protein